MSSSPEDHSLSFQYTDDKDDECFDMAFNKKRADDRKDLDVKQICDMHGGLSAELAGVDQ